MPDLMQGFFDFADLLFPNIGIAGFILQRKIPASYVKADQLFMMSVVFDGSSLSLNSLNHSFSCMILAGILFFLLQVNSSLSVRPDSAVARVQFEEAMEANDTLGMAQAWYRQGLICEEAGDPAKSNEALQRALALASQAKNY
jgi:hypothetical protein